VDEVAAEHLSADIVVHYGRSCLSETQRIPTIYVFGRCAIDCDALYEKVVAELASGEGKVVVLFDVLYFWAMKDVERRLGEALGAGRVVFGTLPGQVGDQGDLGLVLGGGGGEPAEVAQVAQVAEVEGGGCCGGGGGGGGGGCCEEAGSRDAAEDAAEDAAGEPAAAPLTVGGLHVPLTAEELPECDLLYIGDNQRQLTNIMMRCSSEGGTKTQMSFDPTTSELHTSAAAACSREVSGSASILFLLREQSANSPPSPAPAERQSSSASGAPQPSFSFARACSPRSRSPRSRPLARARLARPPHCA
jgi:hypothetical protein